MNQVEYSANQILSYLSKNQMVRMAVTVAIIIIAILLVWLLLRNIRLWYWKTENIIKGLEKIDDKIGGIEDKIERINLAAKLESESAPQLASEPQPQPQLASEPQPQPQLASEPQPEPAPKQQWTKEELEMIMEKEIDDKIRD